MWPSCAHGGHWVLGAASLGTSPSPGDAFRLSACSLPSCGVALLHVSWVRSPGLFCRDVGLALLTLHRYHGSVTLWGRL